LHGGAVWQILHIRCGRSRAGRRSAKRPELVRFPSTGTQESDQSRGSYPSTTPLRSDAIRVGMAGE
jgi:hypothetical protein